MDIRVREQEVPISKLIDRVARERAIKRWTVGNGTAAFQSPQAPVPRAETGAMNRRDDGREWGGGVCRLPLPPPAPSGT